MNTVDIVKALAGGALIGGAAVMLLVLSGRIAGISGILGGLITPAGAGDRAWRMAFLLGLVVAPAVYSIAISDVTVQMQAGGWMLIIAGLLVGIGTRLGSGCTSGHAVCGIARRSLRSFAATLVFMAVAMLTVFMTRHAFA